MRPRQPRARPRPRPGSWAGRGGQGARRRHSMPGIMSARRATQPPHARSRRVCTPSRARHTFVGPANGGLRQPSEHPAGRTGTERTLFYWGRRRSQEPGPGHRAAAAGASGPAAGRAVLQDGRRWPGSRVLHGQAGQDMGLHGRGAGLAQLLGPPLPPERTRASMVPCARPCPAPAPLALFIHPLPASPTLLPPCSMRAAWVTVFAHAG